MSLHLKDKINYVNNTNPKTTELFQAVMRAMEKLAQSKQNKDEADQLLSALFSGGEEANKLIEELSDEQKVRLQKMADEITRHNAERSRIEERVPERSRSRSRSIPPAQLASPSLPRDPKVSLGEHLHKLVPEDRRSGVFTLRHHPQFDPDSDSEESDSRNGVAHPPQILNIPLASSVDERAPDLSDILESNQDAINGNAPDAPISPRELVESPPHKPVQMMDENNVLKLHEEEDDPENYKCCGKYIQDMKAIMCETCNKWFHTCCLVKEPFKMTQPEVDFWSSSGLDQLWERCPICEKEGRSRKRKRKESNDLPASKRFKIRMKNLPPELLTQYQNHGIAWLRGFGIHSLLKCEYPNEETIPVERGKSVKLPEKCFSKDSLSFETRHVVHEWRKPAINTLDAQQKVLDAFAKRWPPLKGTTFEVIDSSHMQVLEYLEHEGFEYLNDEPPIRNLDPPKFYHELEQAAQDIFDENPINSDTFKKRRKTWVNIEKKFGVKILSELSRSIEDDECFQRAFGDFAQLVKKDIIKILETPEFVPFRKSLTEKDFAKQFKQYKSILQKNGLEPMSFETIVGRLKTDGHYNNVDQLIKDINDVFRCAQLTHRITAIEFKKIAKYGKSLMKNELFQWKKKRESVADQGDKAQA